MSQKFHACKACESIVGIELLHGGLCFPCRRDLQIRDQATKRAQERQDAYEKQKADFAADPAPAYGEYRVPARYRDTIKPSLPKKALEWSGEPWSALLVGPVGCGKTCAATWLYTRTAIELGINPAMAVWSSVPVTMHELRERVGSDQSASGLRALLQAEILLLDDLGAERETEWTLETVRVVIMHRHQHMLPTIVTANAKDSAVFDQRYPREASRLSEGLVVPISGRDRRRKTGSSTG